MKSDIWKDVSPIVKGNNTETLLDRERNARFRVDDEQLVSAGRYLDERVAVRRAIRANLHLALWSRTVQRKAAQRVTSAGKKCFAQRHAAVIEWLSQSNAKTIRPDDVMKCLLVIGHLAGQLRKVHTRTELR